MQNEAEKIINNKSLGFSLAEVVIALSIFAVLLLVVIDLFLNVFNNPKREIASMDNIEQARVVTSDFVDEVRNATTGNDGSYPLNQAGDSQIIFYSSDGLTGSVVHRIRYYILNNNLYKGVIAPTGSPLTYNTSSETTATLLTGLGNGSAPIFYYYNGNYNGSGSALSQPINVNQVKFVKINLMVPRQTTTNSTGTFSISAGADMRNLKNNLGN